MTPDGRLSRYREIETLGRGGMASVVLAEDTVLGRQVALKRMHRSDTDPRSLVRMRREALVGASLSHRNVIPIYDVIDSEEGDFVIVMEYVQGETLRDALRREGRLEPHEALRVLEGIGAGLDAIHRQGIVHRDVKPANVLLGADGNVKLADLGIASVPDHTRITTAGTVLGSFRYMAPEQLRDGPATRAIDVYALAAVTFEVLSGRQARREANPLAVAHAIANQPPPDLREAWPAAPAQAAKVLMDGMCRDPAGRPTSAGELVSRLSEALEPQPTAPVTLPDTIPDGRAAPAAAAVGDAAVALAARTSGRTDPKTASDGGSGPRGGGPPASAPAGNGGSDRDEAVSAPAPPPRKTHRVSPRARWRRLAAPLALAIAGGAVLTALLLSSQGSSTGGHSSSSSGARTKSTGSRARTSATRSTAAGSTGGASRSAASTTSSAPATTPSAVPGGASAASTASAGAPAPTSPVGAVEAFYELAAAHRYSDAWALADSTFRNQLGGYESFTAGQAADRSITFDAAGTLRQSSDSATVQVQTTSVRTTGTEHCAGTVQAVPGGSGRWLVHTISINCR